MKTKKWKNRVMLRCKHRCSAVNGEPGSRGTVGELQPASTQPSVTLSVKFIIKCRLAEKNMGKEIIRFSQ